MAVLFSSNCNPTWPGDSRCAMIPEPTTTATSSPVPITSASSRRAMLPAQPVRYRLEASQTSLSLRSLCMGPRI